MSAPLTDAWTEDEPTVEPRKAPNASGAALLDDARSFIARFVTMPSQAALDIATVWAAHTHFRNTDEHLAWYTSPRIYFGSDEPGSGKSSALERVLGLSARGKQILDATPGSFALLINEDRATVGLDEIDILFGAGGAKAVLRSLLNAGYRQGTEWSRMNKPPMPVFSAVALAGLARKFKSSSELAPLRSRSIMITMKPGKTPDRYRASQHQRIEKELSQALGKWAQRNLDVVENIPENIPDGIDNRLLEVSEPLFAIADRAGGHWPTSIREAARELLLGEVDAADEMSLSERLLTDLAAAFGGDRLVSRVELIDRLYMLPGAMWPKLWPSRQSAPAELTAMLSPLGIAAQPVRVTGGVVRGYKRSDFAPLWLDLGVGLDESIDEAVDLDADDMEAVSV